MLFIGKISYSLYLVHWPVIVFYKYWKFDSLQANDYFFIVVITAFLTLFLWYFIETRYRYSWPIKLSINNHVLKTSFVMMLSVFFVGIYFSKSDGVPSRFPKEFYMSADQVVQERNRYWNKFNKDGRAILKVNDQKDNVMIIGNSHSIDLVYSLRENGSQDNFIFIPTTHKCYNFIIPGKVEDKKICSNVEKKITEYSEWSDLDAVYLHDNWPRNKTSGVEKVI